MRLGNYKCFTLLDTKRITTVNSIGTLELN